MFSFFNIISKFLIFSLFLFSSNISLALTGKEISEKIITTLKTKGYVSKPVIKENRQFKNCNQTLDIKNIFKDYKTVIVSCKSPLNWKITLRTNAKPINSIKIKSKVSNKSDLFQVKNSVLILTNSLKRGEVIKQDDLILKTNYSSPLGNGYFTEKKHLIGRKLRQNLSIGKIIKTRHLEENWMIEKGQSIIIVSDINGVNVMMKGNALQNGYFNQLIKVKNKSSGKVVQGRIVDKKNIFIKH